MNLLVVIDDDMYVDGNWLTHMVGALTRGRNENGGLGPGAALF